MRRASVPPSDDGSPPHGRGDVESKRSEVRASLSPWITQVHVVANHLQGRTANHHREQRNLSSCHLFSRPMAEQQLPTARAGGDCSVSIGTIILIILVIALLGGFSGVGGGPFYGTGYYGGGGLGLVVVILLILLLLGRLYVSS